MNKKNRKNIALFTHNYPINSKERKDAGIFLFDFAQELSKTHNVYVFAPDFGGKKEKYKKVPVYWYKWGSDGTKLGDWSIKNPKSLLNFIKLIYYGRKEAVKFSKENNIDHILAAWVIPSGIIAYFVSNKLNISYSTWSLGSDINKYIKFPVLKQLSLRSLNKASNRYANSFALNKEIEALTDKKALLLPAITDFNSISKSDKTKNNQVTKFLFVGRLEKVKGIDILIEAVDKLKQDNIKFYVNVLGEGTLMKELKSEVRKKKLTSYIKFHGNADKSKVLKYMQESDCLVVPSRSESLPLVILEASRVNLPVIATDVGDSGYIIDKYKIGIKVESENVNNLYKEMNNFIKLNKKQRNKFSAGLKKLSQDYTQEVAVNTFVKNLKN